MQTHGGTQLKRINDIADELVSEGHTKSDSVKARQRRINQIWNDLQKQLRIKADSVGNAEQIAQFNENCEDTRAWMSEKFQLLNQQPDASDIKALQVHHPGIVKPYPHA